MLYATTYLIQMDTNRFQNALHSLKTTFPNEGPALAARLQDDDWMVTCSECQGSGRKAGSTATAQANPCLNCVGSGKIIQISPRVMDFFLALLNEIEQAARENQTVAEAKAKALAITHKERKIAALRELLVQYPQRPEIVEMEPILATMAAEVAAVEAAAQKRKEENARRDREHAEYEKILANIDRLPASSIPVMVKEIDRYQEQYPGNPYRLELEVQKAELLQRSKRHRLLWRALYACGGLLGFALIVAAVRGLAGGRPQADPLLHLPGYASVDEIDDPLAGTFDDEN